METASGTYKIGEVAKLMADLILDGNDTIPKGFRVTDNLR